MARERSPNRDKAKEMYLNSNGDIKLKNIAEALGVLDTQVRKWKSQDKWDNDLKATLLKQKRNVTNKNVPNDNEISWIDIENEYVTDIRKKPCTLENLANKYNVSIGTIEKYSMEHDWSIKRKKYKETVKQKAAEKSAEIISSDVAKVIAKHFNISDKIVNAINEALEDKSELYKYVEKLRNGYGSGEFEEKIVTETLDTINDGKLLNIVNALDKLQKMQRQTLNILDEKDRIKLMYEKQKIDIAIGKQDEDSNANLLAQAVIDKMKQRNESNGE